MAISHAANTPAKVPAELGRAKKEAKKLKRENCQNTSQPSPTVCQEGPCRGMTPAGDKKGTSVSPACVKGWVDTGRRERWAGVQPWRQEDEPVPYRADGKALLQPVSAPASFCLCQINPCLRKNSSRRVTDRPQAPPSRDTTARPFTSRKNLDGKRERLREEKPKVVSKPAPRGCLKFWYWGGDDSTRGRHGLAEKLLSP